jgi:hypothetical protein
VAAAEGVAVDRVLETLHELLQVVDTPLQRSDPNVRCRNVLTLGLRLVFIHVQAAPLEHSAEQAVAAAAGRLIAAQSDPLDSSFMRTLVSRSLKAAGSKGRENVRGPSGPSDLS